MSRVSSSPFLIWKPAVFYALAALLLSIWLLGFQYLVASDGVPYARMAQNIVTGKGISVNSGEPWIQHPPFYSLIIGIVYLCLGNLELSAHLVSAVSFSLTLIPLFFLSRNIYSQEAAHWSALLYVTNGFLLIHSHLVVAEPLFTLLVMIELYLFHHLIQDPNQKISQTFLLGLVAAAASLTRPEGLIFFSGGGLAFFLLGPGTWTFRGRRLLLSVTVFLALLFPYFGFVSRENQGLVVNRAVTGHLIYRQLAVAHRMEWLEVKKVIWGLTEDHTRYKLDQLEEEFDLVHYLKKDDFALLRSFIPSLIHRFLELGRYLFGGLGFLWIGASFLGAGWDLRRKRSELLLLFSLLPFLSYGISAFETRRFYFVYPLFLLWIGNGIETMRNWARVSFGLSQKRSIAVVFYVCLLFASLSGWYLFRVLSNHPLPTENRELGTWMKQNIPGIEEEPVAAREPAVNFYSGSRVLGLPFVEKFEYFLTFMAHRKARYFVVSEDLDRPILDTYRFLLDETKPPPPGILRKHLIRGNHKLILYEIGRG